MLPGGARVAQNLEGLDHWRGPPRLCRLARFWGYLTPKTKNTPLVRLDKANKEIRRLTAVLTCANGDHKATIEDLEGQVASLESRIEEVDAKRREMRTELSGTKTDVASVIKNLKRPWTSFLAIYNEMCLPVDEQPNDESLKVLFEKVLDAKLKQVVDKPS